jgi:hypothetical protein
VHRRLAAQEARGGGGERRVGRQRGEAGEEVAAEGGIGG